MNARGKPLTEFENFKANFSQYLKSIEEKSKLDNEWLDIFWNLEKKENSEIVTENVDEKFFSFFKNITLNFYAETNDIDRGFVDNYNLFDTYSEVYQDETYVNSIIKIFDGLISYDDTENIFNNFISSTINYWERLHFYALGHFFIKYGKVTDENKTTLDRWLRVTKNLINNTRIEGAKEFENGIHSINILSENIDKIYSYISTSSDTIKYFAKLQREEESLKAKLILENAGWENQFLKIEKHSYFDGQVGFILSYSKNEESNYKILLFDDYSTKLSRLFSDEFRENYDFLFQRALLSKGNYLPQVGNSENYTFCIFEESLRTKLDNWRKVFNDEEDTLLLKELLNDIDKNDILNSLKNIINNHSLNDLRKLIIEHPDNISYCQFRQIRWYSDDEIYLLSKKQMNGRHKELISWDLFCRKFIKKEYLPFSNKSWYRESTSWDKPCIVLERFEHKENSFAIDITYDKENKYALKFYDWNSVEIPSAIEKLIDDLDFEGNKILLPENEIESKIVELCNKLKNLEQE